MATSPFLLISASQTPSRASAALIRSLSKLDDYGGQLRLASCGWKHNGSRPQSNPSSQPQAGYCQQGDGSGGGHLEGLNRSREDLGGLRRATSWNEVGAPPSRRVRERHLRDLGGGRLPYRHRFQETPGSASRFLRL